MFILLLINIVQALQINRLKKLQNDQSRYVIENECVTRGDANTHTNTNMVAQTPSESNYEPLTRPYQPSNYSTLSDRDGNYENIIASTRVSEYEIIKT